MDTFNGRLLMLLDGSEESTKGSAMMDIRFSI
jgi:hypothetical protein